MKQERQYFIFTVNSVYYEQVTKPSPHLGRRDCTGAKGARQRLSGATSELPALWREGRPPKDIIRDGAGRERWS